MFTPEALDCAARRLRRAAFFARMPLPGPDPSPSWRCRCRWPSPSRPGRARLRGSIPRPSSAAFWCRSSAAPGSRSGGPAGAFIILVAATVAEHGMDGLILATFSLGADAGRHGASCVSGTFIKFIPFPVTVGFTAGIAVHQFSPARSARSSACRRMTNRAKLVAKLGALWDARAGVHPRLPSACRSRPSPSSGESPQVATEMARHAHRDRRRGSGKHPDRPAGRNQSAPGSAAFPRPCRFPALPEISLARIVAVLPAATAFTLLGARSNPCSPPSSRTA